MKRIVAAVALLLMVRCSSHVGPEAKDNASIKIFPRVQLVFTGEMACVDIVIMGDLPIPAVAEVLDEDTFGDKVPASRALWKGERYIRTCSQYTEQYYNARMIQHMGEYQATADAMRRGDGQPFGTGRLSYDIINEGPRWNEEIELTFRIRAPEPEDFQGQTSRYDLELEFGRADGKVYKQSTYKIKLQCPMCSV